ncbi:MAG: 1-acyl-sn-glycerol-3-phosphate acyltransferase [Clostridia bacterium]|nr:1-acyl-sn-glycerol-3-phosphate acyltransferase [Clostridia bacterium]
MPNKKKKWMKLRHRVVRNIAWCLIYPYSRLKYGIHIQKFKEQGDRPYLILFNHQTAFDQFFAGMAFKGPVYYIASEDLFSKGWLSSLIRFLVAPIPIKKQTTDVAAVMTCLRVAREGGTIAMAPEGNRTYSGKNVFINPTIAPLARKLGLPIVLYHITGGYGVHPRWSDVVRRGRMDCYVHRVIEPEEYRSLSDDALYRLICDGLTVNEAHENARFHHKKRAEYLERAMYVCPQCGLSTFESHGNLISCKTCRRALRYTPTTALEGVGFDFPFRFVSDWYDYQCDFINRLQPTDYKDKPLYKDRVSLSEVIVYKKKLLIEKAAELILYGDKITIGDRTFPFDEVTAVTVLGKNKLNIYHDKRIYQCKGDKRFNALKYVNLYYRYKNISKGDENGKFLGL